MGSESLPAWKLDGVMTSPPLRRYAAFLWPRQGRWSPSLSIMLTLTTFLLLLNILFDGSSCSLMPHHLPGRYHTFTGPPSIYRGRPRVGYQPVSSEEMRVAQERAFNTVENFILSRPELEYMAGRRLPRASATTLDDINFGQADEISDKRRADRIINFVTPTYKRVTQMVDLVRLSQTLQAAAYTQLGIVHWIVIEDTDKPTQRVRALLQQSGLPFSHIAQRSAPKVTGHGMAQRNAGVQVVRDLDVDGVIYFADDDNAYDMGLVTELTRTKSVGVFGVGLVGNGTYERCHVNAETGLVDRLISNLRPHRKWGIDMAGFAFSTVWDAHRNHTAKFDVHGRSGTLEPLLLKSLLGDLNEFQPLAADCTRILVWHTRTQINRAGFRFIADDPEYEFVSALI